MPLPSKSKRIVLTTFGSLGDLHPYLALALELKKRGHEPIVATSATYGPKAAALGIRFHPVRPDIPEPEKAKELMKHLMDARRGSERVICDFIMPSLRASYDDVMAIADGADLLVSHVITFATRLVAEKLGLTWASSILAPLGLMSVYDPPVFAPIPQLERFRRMGPLFHRPVLGLMKWAVRSWGRPWHRLRAEVGLPSTWDHPLFEGQHAPRLVLALFSRLLADKQPDWPSQTLITGFPFFDQDGSGELPENLARFLEDGPPPIVFTLGSSAVLDAGTFYEQSAAAAGILGQRAVLLIGADPTNHPTSLPRGVMVCDYAPYTKLFPRAAAIVHQAGVGTTAQAMRAGKPMLIMPYSHDQPDNAARMARLGIARVLSRNQYTATKAARELRRLLETTSYTARAAQVGRQVREEHGVATACDALESMLG